MKLTLKNASVYDGGIFKTDDFSFEITDNIPYSLTDNLFKLNNCFVFPAFCDVHVHLREPGFSYKETIRSGTLAAARGGFGDIFSMPNLNPVPSDEGKLKVQLDLIKEYAVIRVHPYGSITVDEKGEVLSDFNSLAKYCPAFSDDGRGVQDENIMRKAMCEAQKLGKVIAAHCEDNSLLRGGYIHDGEYARLHGHKGISSESEWRQIERDLRLAKETGCKYHVCHVSCKESVELIRKAKAEGADVTCETAPHYLILDDSCLKEDGRFKMNPPIRSKADREALIEGLSDGTVDMIATDHAPHSAAEKSGGLEKSLMGVVGLETAFSALYTHLVKPGLIPLERLINAMSDAPRKRFGLAPTKDICVFDPTCEYTVNPADFLSKGRATPFEGEKLFGVCRLTVSDGKIAYLNLN